MTSFFKVLQIKETTIETSTLPAICTFKRLNAILYLIFQNSEIFISFMTPLSPNWKKRSKLVFHVSMVIERSKSIVKGNLRWSIHFWNHYLKILKFWVLLVTSPVQKWVKKVHVGISCTNGDRKMKIKSKRYFQANYSFMKPFSQNFEVLTQRGGVIKIGLEKEPNSYLMY